MPQDRPESSWISLRDAFDWTHFICRLHAMLLLPFLRRRWGAEEPGIVGLIAFFVVLPVYISFAESYFMLQYFWIAWLAVTLFRRLESVVMRWRGARIHSEYEGYPWLAARVFFWVKDDSRLYALEPLLCLAIGALLMPVEKAFAQFVMFGFVSLGALDCLQRSIEFKRKQALINQAIDLEREAELHRAMR